MRKTEKGIILSRREFLRLVGGACAVGIASLSGCGGSGKSVAPPKEPDIFYALMTNPDDPLLIAAEYRDGRRIYLYGDRDSRGYPSAVRRVVLIDQNREISVYDFNSDNRPVRMIAPDGSFVEMNWLSPTQVAVDVIAEGGDRQFSTVYDMNTPVDTESAALLATENRLYGNTRPRKGQKISLEFVPSCTTTTSRTRGYSTLQAGNGNCMVVVTGCSAVDEIGMVQVLVFDTLGEVPNIDPRDVDPSRFPFALPSLRPVAPIYGAYPAVPIGDGKYVATIPVNLDEPIDLNFDEICSSIHNLVSAPCEAIMALQPEPFCAYLAARAGLAFPKVFLICEAIMRGYQFYCAAFSSPAPGGPSFGEEICKQLKPLNRTIEGEVRLVPVFYSYKGSKYGDPVTAPARGPFPTLYIDIGDETTIRSLELDPPNPPAGVGYKGVAQVYCLPAGTIVSLSIVGTDGYTDSVSTTISQTQPQGQFQLFVPGAASGVRDVVEVVVRRPDGKEYKLTASLVFG